MKLTPLSKSDVPSKRVRISEYRQLLETFVASNNEAAKIEGTPGATASAATQLRRYARLGELPVSVRVSGKEIYLVRED